MRGFTMTNHGGEGFVQPRTVSSVNNPIASFSSAHLCVGADRLAVLTGTNLHLLGMKGPLHKTDNFAGIYRRLGWGVLL
jgi:hypothetical protein